MAVSDQLRATHSTGPGDSDPASGRLLARARRVENELRDLLGELGEALGRGVIPSEYEPKTGAGPNGRSTCLISGMKKINDTIRFTLESSREEVLLAQPGGARSKSTLAKALPTHLDCLKRGVITRTLYQHPARYDQPTKDYVRETAEHGAQVRTLDEFFDRLIVVDHQVVIVPTNSERTEAAMFTDPAVARFAGTCSTVSGAGRSSSSPLRSPRRRTWSAPRSRRRSSASSSRARPTSRSVGASD